MEQSLVMLQAQQEICDMRHADYRDGYLLAIRDKVSGDTGVHHDTTDARTGRNSPPFTQARVTPPRRT
jgi:hypothetical protein